MAKSKLTADEQLADALSGFFADPLGYVMFIFPWDTEPAIQLVELQSPYKERFPKCKYGPDVWACEFLDQWGAEIKKRHFDGKKAVSPIRFATASGHGIGKSTLSAWIIKFIMDTRPFCRGTVTANTGAQLKSKTWAEVGKWHKLSLTQHWFNYSDSRGAMSMKRVGYENEWVCNAITWKENSSEAFAGQHAANSTSFYLFDEASVIPDPIFEVRGGGLTDGEPMTFDFGNPTRKSGVFFEECVGKLRQRHIVRSIDSRKVFLTNKGLIQEYLEDYGEDSDYFKVKVRGVFPAAGSVQFIPTDQVELAMSRLLVLDKDAQLLIGVDVARFGDDETVIYPRVGMDARSFPISRYRGIDTNQTVGHIIETVQFFRELGKECAGLFIDGGNTGGAVIDNLRHLGYNPIEVTFGGGAIDSKTYRFKSDELWGRMRDGIKTRLALPDATSATGMLLKEQLTQREFGYTLLGNKIHLESKKDMKERLKGGCASPDVADALACTYAQDVMPVIPGELPPAQKVTSEYDPHEAKD